MFSLLPTRDLVAYKDIPGANERLDAFHSTLNGLSPLVSEDRLKAHLRFVGAYVTLLEKVDPYVKEAKEPSEALRVFLARAVHRFGLWLNSHSEDHALDDLANTYAPLPPLDVAIILHACMLSPHRYFEDGLKRFPQLLALGPFPLERIVRMFPCLFLQSFLMSCHSERQSGPC